VGALGAACRAPESPTSAPASGRELPIWGEDFSPAPEGSALRGSDVSPEHSFVADPRPFTLGDRLFLLFEAFSERSGLGQIWLAQSRDAVHWEHFQRVSVQEGHMSHPEVRVLDGVVHAFYNVNQGGVILHRASPVEGFPQWGEESAIFRGIDHAWHHLVDFTFLQAEGRWYLLGITGNGTKVDQWIRGLVLPAFGLDWTRAAEVTPNPVARLAGAPWLAAIARPFGAGCAACLAGRWFPHPLLDVADSPWIVGINELTALEIGPRPVLLMGARDLDSGLRSVTAFEVSELGPSGLRGHWLSEGFVLPLGGPGWDEQDVHRADVVRFGDRWVLAYDANRLRRCPRPERGCWRIRFATMPYGAAGPRADDAR